jgi:hypothetical protein
MSHGIPITYLAPAKEMDGNSDMRLYARWTDFTASAYGQPVHDAPPLDAEGLSWANQFALSTYEVHQEKEPFIWKSCPLLGWFQLMIRKKKIQLTYS